MADGCAGHPQRVTWGEPAPSHTSSHISSAIITGVMGRCWTSTEGRIGAHQTPLVLVVASTAKAPAGPLRRWCGSRATAATAFPADGLAAPRTWCVLFWPLHGPARPDWGAGLPLRAARVHIPGPQVSAAACSPACVHACVCLPPTRCTVLAYCLQKLYPLDVVVFEGNAQKADVVNIYVLRYAVAVVQPLAARPQGRPRPPSAPPPPPPTTTIVLQPAITASCIYAGPTHLQGWVGSTLV